MSQYFELLPSRKDFETFRYCGPLRRPVYRKLRKLITGMEQRLYDLYLATAVGSDRIVDSGLDYNLFNKQLRLIQKLWHGQRTKVNGEPQEMTRDMIVILKNLLNKNPQLVNLIYENLCEHYVQCEKYSKKRWVISSIEDIRKRQMREITPWVTGFLAIARPQISTAWIRTLGMEYAYASKMADDIADIKNDLPQGIINLPKIDLLRYVRGVVIKDDKVVRVDGKDLHIDKRFIRNQIDEVEVQFEHLDKVLENCTQDIVDERTIRILTLSDELSKSFLQEAKTNHKIHS